MIASTIPYLFISVGGGGGRGNIFDQCHALSLRFSPFETNSSKYCIVHWRFQQLFSHKHTWLEEGFTFLTGTVGASGEPKNHFLTILYLLKGTVRPDWI